MERHPRDAGRLARVIASDLVAYFHAEGSPYAASERSVSELACQGLKLLRSRFGDDETLERYYADCIGSAFESLTLAAPTLAVLRDAAGGHAAGPFVMRHPPDEALSIVFGPRDA